MKAVCLIREQPLYRRDAFVSGLESIGAKVRFTFDGTANPDDVLVIWNRYGTNDQIASKFRRVIVCENGYLGRDWRGGHWYSMSLDHHNGAGRWYPGGPERWDSWGVDLAPWRETGETVILPQRGAGPPGIAMPPWFVNEAKRFAPRARVREHPGENDCVPLDEDLKDCGLVVTWGSGAAIKALTMGIPVAHWFDRWIAKGAARIGKDGIERPKRSGRLEMFRSLAWAMWNTEEIANGAPFRHLLLR